MVALRVAILLILCQGLLHLQDGSFLHDLWSLVCTLAISENFLHLGRVLDCGNGSRLSNFMSPNRSPAELIGCFGLSLTTFSGGSARSPSDPSENGGILLKQERGRSAVELLRGKFAIYP